MPIAGNAQHAALWLAGIGLVAMTVMVAWQVFCRYVLNDSPSWTEPGAVMLMSWFIFLGAAVGVRENYHLGFDVLLYVLPKGGKKWLRMISDLVAFAFGIGMVWYGIAAGQPHLEHDLAVARHFRRLGLCAAGRRRHPDRAFSLERIVLRLAGAPIDDVLDELAPAEVAVRAATSAKVKV